MELLALFMCILLFADSGRAEDVYVRIVPNEVYVDSRDVSISCVFNSQTVKKPQYISISRNGWFGTHNIATITDGNPVQIGYFFSGGNFTSRMEISGSIAEKNLTILLKSVECLDEGHYECEAAGYDDTNALKFFSDSNSIEVKSQTERPIVTINGVEFQDKSPVTVTEGSMVSVECDAHVGKPPKTMYWYRYDTATNSYIVERNMVGKAERRLPVGELCKWYTTFSLGFTASMVNQETILKCTLDNYEREVIIRVRPKVGP